MSHYYDDDDDDNRHVVVVVVLVVVAVVGGGGAASKDRTYGGWNLARKSILDLASAFGIGGLSMRSWAETSRFGSVR